MHGVVIPRRLNRTHGGPDDGFRVHHRHAPIQRTDQQAEGKVKTRVQQVDEGFEFGIGGSRVVTSVVGPEEVDGDEAGVKDVEGVIPNSHVFKFSRISFESEKVFSRKIYIGEIVKEVEGVEEEGERVEDP